MATNSELDDAPSRRPLDRRLDEWASDPLVPACATCGKEAPYQVMAYFYVKRNWEAQSDVPSCGAHKVVPLISADHVNPP